MKNSTFILKALVLILSAHSGFLFSQVCDDHTNVTCPQAEMISGFEFLEDYCMVGCNQQGESGLFNPSMNGCQGSPFQTAWYALPAQSMNCYLDIYLQSTEINIPTISVYNGNCQNMKLIRCNQGTDGDVQLRTVPFSEDILIAVSSGDGTIGEFSLCVMISEDENLCNVNSKLEVISTDQGSALTGPYRPGEKVEVCYTVNSYNVDYGCNFLHAIVPIFGNGWDPASFDLEGQPSLITQELVTQGKLELGGVGVSCDGGPGGSWEWYPESTVKYKLNSDNPLQLTSASMIPPAWVFLNSFDPDCFIYDESCCTNPTTDPNLGYGDHNYPLCFPDNDLKWNICFELIANTQVDCENSSDCTIAFKTLSDGEIGTYTDIGCTQDRVDYLDATVVCCEAPEIEVEKNEYNICEGDEIEISLKANDDSANFYWFINGEEQVYLDTENLRILKVKGEETIEIELYATNGCVSEPFYITVTADTPAEAVITQDPPLACSDDEIRLIIESVEDLSAYTIEWNNDPSLSAMDILADSGIDTYVAVVKKGECATVIEHILILGVSPVVQQMDDLYLTCDVDAYEIEAGAGLVMAEHEFTWMQDNEVIGESSSIVLEKEGEYIVEITNRDSGCSSYDTIQVLPNPSDLKVEFLQGSEIEITAGSTVDIDIVHNLETNEISSIRWFHDGTIDCDDCLSISAIPQESVDYIVEVTDIYGCSQILSVSVRVLDTSDTPGIYIPNVIMPDVEGENGYLRIYDNGQIDKVFTFSIYNRWGENVHMIRDFNVGDERANWNGMAKDDYLEPGVYMYMVDYVLQDGTREQIIGHVTLLK